MPRVEKARGGRVHVRGIGRFSVGDQADVSEEEAAYLCGERGDFQRIDNEEADSDDDRGDGDGAADVPEPGEAVCTCDVGDACSECGGECPTVKTDGEVCGGDRPCQYHDRED